MYLPFLMVFMCELYPQTLRGHEHVVETVSYGKKPVDAAAIVALSSPMRSNEVMVSCLCTELYNASASRTVTRYS